MDGEGSKSGWHPAFMPNTATARAPSFDGNDSTSLKSSTESTTHMHQPASQCAEKEDAVEPDDGAAEAWLSNHGDDDDSHAWLPEVADPLPDVGPPAMASEKPNSERNAELIPGKAIPTLAEGVNDDSSIEAPTVSTTMPNDNNPSQPLELRDIDSKHGESADPCSANHVDDDADAWLAIEDANTHEDVAPQAHQEPASNEDGDAWLSKENDDDVDDELLAPEEEPASQTIEGPTAVDHNEDDKKAWFEDEDEQAGTGPLVSEGQAPQTTQSLVRDGDIGASHANDKVELAESLLASDTIAAQATKARPAQETEARAVQVTEVRPAQAIEAGPAQKKAAKLVHETEAPPTQAIEALTDQATEAPTDQATEAPTDQAAEERPAQVAEARPATEAPLAQVTESRPAKATEARPATEAQPVQTVDARPAQAAEATPAQATEARPAQGIEVQPSQAVEATPTQAAEAPTAQPIETPTARAMEAPIDQGTEARQVRAKEPRPVQAIEAPATQPIEAPTTQAIEATPTRASEARPSQATEARPVQAIEAPIAQATEARSAKPTEETPAQPTEETSAQPTKETPAQPTKETPAQPTEETSAQPTKETPAQPAEARSAQATEARPSQATKAIPVQVIEARPVQAIETPSVQAIEARPAQTTEARPAQATGATPAQTINASTVRVTEALSSDEVGAGDDHVDNAIPTSEEHAPRTVEAPIQNGDDAWFSRDENEHFDAGWLASKDQAPLTDENSNQDAWLKKEHDHAVGEPKLPGGPDTHETEKPEMPLQAGGEDGNQPTADVLIASGSTTGGPTTSAQHSSSMSFARTVSHEISFADDDDAEWNLQRTQVDPSSRVPPSDQTRPNPVASPPVANLGERKEQPPMPTKTLEILDETKRKAEHGTDRNMTSGTQQVEPEVTPALVGLGLDTCQSLSREMQYSQAQVSEVRDEEGLHLIPRSDIAETAGQSNRVSSLDASFTKDDNDDDFFSQIQTPGTHADISVNPPLEQTSTLPPSSSFSKPPLEEKAGNFEAPRIADTGLAVADAAGSQTNNEPPTEDIATKWEEAFAGDGDDDDFLVDDAAAEPKEFDPSAFLGSDDEGLLEDDTDAMPQPVPVVSPRQPVDPKRYVPASPSPQVASTFITPAALAAQSPYQQPALPPFSPPTQYSQPAAPQPEPAKAQSFADKSKGGYSSPYDLPTELMPNLVRPRKRSSLSQQSQGQTPPPPISAATFPVGRSPSAGPPPAAVRPAGQPSLNQKSSAPALRGHSSFFEDLPMAAKPRPASRQSNPAQLPSQYVPTAQQPPSLPPPRDFAPPPPPASLPSQPPAAVPVANLVAPERASPYAALQSSMVPLPPPPAQASRYSPALASPQHAPPTSASRYSPAPPSSRSGSLYSPNTITPHLPRTSSPLAHIEPGGDKPHGATHPPNGEMQRRSSASFEPRLTRVPSLPPTREVDEEEERDDESLTRRSFGTTHPTAPLNIPPKFRPLSPLAAQQSPPLPSNNFAQSALSPPKRAISYYAPQIPPATQPGFVPPARASTQSPSTMHSSRQYRPTEAGPRPSSAHSSAHSSAAPVPPRMPQQYYAPAARPRGQSLTMDMVPPTDGREQDPLERWKGAPLFAWGVGGTVVTTFPKSIPRYAMNHSTPTMVRAPGEVKLHHIKDIEPLQDRLAKFPGPLRGKSKKKEALTWLATAIDAQEKDVPDISFHPQLSLEAKRGIERLLLWKLLRIFVEFDGTLEGFAAVEKAVRDVLQPGTVTTPAADPDAMFPNAAGFAAQAGPTPAMQADGIDAGVMEGIRHSLLKGNGEAAVWSAVDKRLWGHAMLISHTISPELYKRVAQEFVRKEVNYPGCSNESIGAFYKVLSGNYDDCVDELVPVHARAGLQLVSKESTSGPATDAIGGLDKWRETLTLILSNRSPDDVRGLNALGKLLSSYGRAEASQICFMFSRNLSVFGGLEDPNVDFVLLGSDHRTQADQFSKETEALQLSEVYEYGLSLGPGSATAAGAPHLAAYKLQHAVTLAEFGYRDKALQYCDAITSAIASQTRRSPYHHIVLEAAVEDFTTRLKQAPKEISSSWMSKPSMNKVSDSVWNRFNKFVAGDEGENGGNGLAGDASGPFARVTSSPNLSRSPSTSNFEMFGAATSGYAASAAPLSSAAASKYAPVATPASGSANPYASSAAQQLPTRTSAGRQSNEYAPNPYEPGYPGTSPSLPHSNSYAPTGHAAQRSSHVLARSESTPLMRSPPTDFAKPPPAGHRPSGLQESPSIYAQLGQAQDNASTSMYGYQPSAFESKPLAIVSPVEEDSGQPEEPESGEYKPPSSQTYGYEPPSSQTYGYEPPSYQPDLESEGEDDDEAPKPKKKSFMDDDEDDIPALKEQGKSKSDKDKENEEMFRKAAEEDAKRAAAQQANKKGWGFSSWFGAKKENANIGEAPSNKPIRAKLGETSSFVYDPDLKRWINKKPGAENTEAKKSTPPPPKAKSRSASGTPAPDSSMPPPPASGRMSVPPPTGPPRLTHTPAPESSQESLGPPPLSRSVSTPGLLAAGPTPPSRPATSMSNASSIDDLLGPPGARKPGQKKPRKSGRYVDVMAK